VVLPPPGYLRDAQALCKRFGTLLVLDEIQTGLGRTGTMFAFEGEEDAFVPDMVVLAKALSGGVAPIAVTVVGREVWERGYGTMDRFDLHSSTFAGNAFSCAAALSTLAILRDDELCANSALRGEQLRDGLRARLADHPLVRDVRGRGLLVGIELGPADRPARGLLGRITAGIAETVSEKVFGQWAALKLLERGIICQPASHHWNVLKLEPPLTVTAEHVQTMIEHTGAIFDEYRALPRLLKDVATRLSSQTLRGFTF
jgi:putrescine aminotransferase